MALAAFDTLKFANRLKSVGVLLAQAEAEAEVLAEVFEVNLRDLATKEDLQREFGDLHKDMEAKFAAVDAKLEKLFLRLVIWLGSIVFLVVNTVSS